MTTNFLAEIAAAEAYIRLLQQGEECRRLYADASISMPPPLRRLLGEDSKKEAASPLLRQDFPTLLKNPERDIVPSGVGEDWVSIRISEVTPETLLLAILRSSGSHLGTGELMSAMRQLRPSTSTQTMYNVIARCTDKKLIEATSGGWKLVSADSGGILAGTYLWAKDLPKNDLTTHRREALLHLLEQHPKLQVMQIVRSLENWKWVRSPVNKDLIKADLGVLEAEGVVKRSDDDPKRWEVVKGQEAAEAAS
jgi:Fe2+ or Zn2+ uptake regulation protein